MTKFSVGDLAALTDLPAGAIRDAHQGVAPDGSVFFMIGNQRYAIVCSGDVWYRELIS